jgi:hypothetical protein
MKNYLIIAHDTMEEENIYYAGIVDDNVTPIEFFERWYLDEYHGLNWDDLDISIAENEFDNVEVYEFLDEPTIINFKYFIQSKDTRTPQEKDPEYKEYIRLAKKFHRRGKCI